MDVSCGGIEASRGQIETGLTPTLSLSQIEKMARNPSDTARNRAGILILRTRLSF